MCKVIVIVVLLTFSAGSAFADDFVAKFFPDVHMGMSTNKIREQRPNATIDYPLMGANAIGFGEVIQTNYSLSTYVFCFKTNGLKALLRSSVYTVGGKVERDSAFDAEVYTNLSNNFVRVEEQRVRRFRNGIRTNSTVTIWVENGTGCRVIHLSESTEATIVYFDPTSFSITNFFLLAQ